jgi:hypothetical protein
VSDSKKNNAASKSIMGRIDESVAWAKGRMCRPCRGGDQVCPACVKAQEAVDLLLELQIDVASKVVESNPVPVVVEVPTVVTKVTAACDACASGELLFDGETCEVCHASRETRGLKGARNRFWDK